MERLKPTLSGNRKRNFRVLFLEKTNISIVSHENILQKSRKERDELRAGY